MFQDIRYAIRRMWQGRAWTALVLLSCALGIGSSAALFSLVEAVLLRDLPVERPGELVYLNWVSGPNGLYLHLNGNSERDENGQQQSTSFSTRTFERVRAQSRTLSNVFAFASLPEATLRVDDVSEIANGQFVSGNYFAALRLQGVRGRPLLEADDRLTAEPAAVISDRYWQRRFNRSNSALGKTLNVNGIAFTIVGITPPGFDGALGYSYAADFALPLAFESRLFPEEGHGEPWSWWVRIMGRLTPGVTRAQAKAELEPLIQNTALDGWRAAPSRGPSSPPRDLPHLQVLDGRRGLADQVRNISPVIASFAAIVGVLLLIVCVNVANLMLAQSANRQREFGVRLAIGASAGRVVRLLLTETIVLCGSAAILGVLLAAWGIDVLGLLVATINGARLDLRLDLRVLGFAILIAALSGAAFGIIPALRATRLDLISQLKAGAHNLIGKGSRITSALVVAQLSLSLTLLVAAGLLIQSVRGLQQVNLGFDASNLLLFEMNPEAAGYDDPRTRSLYEEMIRGLERLPGVQAATTSDNPLASASGNGNSFYLQGRTRQEDDPIIRRLSIRANFVKTMRLTLAQGRDLTERDGENAPRVALVNETLVRQFIEDTNPIGRRFSLQSAERSGEIEIVGVVRDSRVDEVRTEVPPTVFLPYPQRLQGSATFEVRAADPALLIPSIQRLQQRLAPEVPALRFRTQEQQIANGFATEHVLARASVLFGAIALVLACIGLYGMLSYNVARRTSEIAVRMAFGARRNLVIRLVLREVALLLAAGITIGLASALALTRSLQELLYGLTPHDPLTLAGAVVLLVAVGALAGYLPARRAARVEPWEALRCE